MAKNDKDNIIENSILQGLKGKYFINNNYLCSGGNSHVYRVLDSNNNAYAAKVSFYKSTNKNKSNRFNKEKDIIQKLQHKNIISLHDYGTTQEGYLFYIMPIYSGSLRDFFKKKDLSKTYIIEVFINILDGLIYLEKNGIIHRDLKPENILINNKEDIVISDFGIYKEKGFNGDTKPTEKMGNFKYSSPEQRHYEESGEINESNYVNHKADVFAVALMLAEFCNIKNPYIQNSDCFLTYITSLSLNPERKKRLSCLDFYYLLNIYFELLKNKENIISEIVDNSIKINKKKENSIQFTNYDLIDICESNRLFCIDDFINLSVTFDEDYLKINITNTHNMILNRFEHYKSDKDKKVDVFLSKSNYGVHNDVIIFSKNSLYILFVENLIESPMKFKLINIFESSNNYKTGIYKIDLNKYLKSNTLKHQNIHLKGKYYNRLGGEEIYTYKGIKKIREQIRFEYMRLKQDIVIIYSKSRIYFIFDKKVFKIK